jgi:hypothetical protein
VVFFIFTGCLSACGCSSLFAGLLLCSFVVVADACCHPIGFPLLWTSISQLRSLLGALGKLCSGVCPTDNDCVSRRSSPCGGRCRLQTLLVAPSENLVCSFMADGCWWRRRCSPLGGFVLQEQTPYPVRSRLLGDQWRSQTWSLTGFSCSNSCPVC